MHIEEIVSTLARDAAEAAVVVLPEDCAYRYDDIVRSIERALRWRLAQIQQTARERACRELREDRAHMHQARRRAASRQRVRARELAQKMWAAFKEGAA